MAPRKHRETEERSDVTLDKSVMAWRGFVTAVLAYLGIAIGPGSNSSQVQNTLERIDRHLTNLEDKFDRMEKRVDNFAFGFGGFEPGARRK